ncbi:LysE/ArgO family amino acid transporter [Rhodoluna sp.]|uniref:LysE/ArgO family amino acid transporter n=1 Tax=Rhodoluna sp. TaxID=1969481 RepID=UPI0025CDF2CF|nr:LysE/ArgO family amino acid transporter [Rhodoluna sp.]
MNNTHGLIAFLPGFFSGLSLIAAIGAQNAYIIRQGLTRQYTLMIVLFCAAADALLISVGVAGLGALVASLPWLLEIIRWFGVAFITWFGITSLIAATKNDYLTPAEATQQSRGKVLATLFALTFLNPHVYLDTLLFLGSLSTTFGDNRWFFAFGAMTASVVWFFVLGFGAKAASRFMSRPIFWRVLDIFIAAVMFTLAITLAFYRFA